MICQDWVYIGGRPQQGIPRPPVCGTLKFVVKPTQVAVMALFFFHLGAADWQLLLFPMMPNTRVILSLRELMAVTLDSHHSSPAVFIAKLL